MWYLVAFLFALLTSPAQAQGYANPGTVAPNFYAAPSNGSAARFTTTTGRTLSSAALTANTFVYIVLGQSVGGSHAQDNYVGTQDCRVVNLTGDRLVYLDNTGGTELGSTFSPNGYQGWPVYSSMWAKFCDLLIAGGKYDRVISINASSAGEPIARFMPSGALGYLLPLAFFTLNELGIPPSRVNMIIPLEGESDGIDGTSQASYEASMRTWFTVASNFGFIGKWVVPLETYAYGCTSATIRAAQFAVTDGVTKILGPDFDTAINNTCSASACRYAENAAGGCAVNALVHPTAAGAATMMSALKTIVYNNFP